LNYKQVREPLQRKKLLYLIKLHLKKLRYFYNYFSNSQLFEKYVYLKNREKKVQLVRFPFLANFVITTQQNADIGLWRLMSSTFPKNKY